jgi:hypothetical protein
VTPGGKPPPTVLIDACVLYPDVLRGIVLGVAGAGLFRPLWSDRILDEWARAVARDGGDAGPDIALVRGHWPGATVPPADTVAARLSLPDAGDIHVLASAIAGRADTLLTLNLRDFPARVLARDGIRPRHPDPFLLDLREADPGTVAAIAGTIWAQARAAGSPLDLRGLLKRARLPRLGKALGSGPDPKI